MSDLSTNARRKVDALVKEMHAAFQAQEWEKCGQLCVQIEAWEPDNPETATVRGIVAVNSGDPKSAEQYFVKAVNADPKNIGFQMNLGRLYLQQGLPADALARFQAVLALEEEHAEAMLLAGQCFLQLGERQQAYDLFQKVKAKEEASDIVDMALFRAAFQLGRLDESEQYLQAVLERNPEHAEAHFALAQVAMQRGDIVKAEEEVVKSITLRPELDLAYPFLVSMKTFTDEDQALIERMQAYRQRVHEQSPSYVHLSFALGKVMDDLARYDAAFEYIEKANETKHQHLTYNHEAELAHLQAIIDHTNAEQLQCTSPIEDDAPIFIVGMPRCGSTLVEQILAAHPQVEGMGECGFFEAALAEISDEQEPLTLEAMREFTPEDWKKVGGTYLRLVREAYPDARYVTDKSLTNIRFVGAIHQALPKATIVHVQRDALDTCWSIYKNNLVSPAFSYGFNLGQLGYYYRAYERLMEHWRAVLPDGAMYELQYEELVNHQDIETLRLLNMCGLESNDACFHFEKAGNIALTNEAQVRKPMYATSVGAAEPYREKLKVLVDILER